MTTQDASHGYDAIAGAFARGRNAKIGVATARAWARTIRPGGAVLDLGCGNGIPISRTLIEEGLEAWGVDASPAMVAAFRNNFPDVPIACEPAETSLFFGRRFDGIIAWGLIFLLPEPAQVALIRRAAEALEPGGSLLFTSPEPACTWDDLMTGRASRSLGGDAYRAHLAAAGLSVVAEHSDEGDNHYFESLKAGH